MRNITYKLQNLIFIIYKYVIMYIYIIEFFPNIGKGKA